MPTLVSFYQESSLIQVYSTIGGIHLDETTSAAESGGSSPRPLQGFPRMCHVHI